MKRSLLWIIFSILLFTLCSAETFAYSSQSEKLINAFNNQLKSMTAQKKKDYLNIIVLILNEPNVKRNANANAKILISELWEWSSNELKKLKSNQASSYTTKVSNWENHQTLPNIDFNEVRKTLLNWHNELRAEKWIEAIAYHSDLEKSAVEWAQTIADAWISQWVHKRSESDGYYNYNNIKDWFSELDIYFPKETWWKAVFSESVGYRYYKCSNWDCTQKLLESAKKVFDSFIKEWENWTHYKAIVMPHFKQLWIWFGLNPNTNMVYVVFHYAEDVVE